MVQSARRPWLPLRTPPATSRTRRPPTSRACWPACPSRHPTQEATPTLPPLFQAATTALLPRAARPLSPCMLRRARPPLPLLAASPLAPCMLQSTAWVLRQARPPRVREQYRLCRARPPRSRRLNGVWSWRPVKPVQRQEPWQQYEQEREPRQYTGWGVQPPQALLRASWTTATLPAPRSGRTTGTGRTCPWFRRRRTRVLRPGLCSSCGSPPRALRNRQQRLPPASRPQASALRRLR